MPLLKVIKLPLPPTHTKSLERQSTSSLADLSQVLMVETAMLEDVEASTNGVVASSRTVAVVAEALQEAGARAHPPMLD